MSGLPDWQWLQMPFSTPSGKLQDSKNTLKIINLLLVKEEFALFIPKIL